MELTINSLSWAVPGYLTIWFYHNITKPKQNTRTISNWEYLISVVFIAIITNWLINILNINHINNYKILYQSIAGILLTFLYSTLLFLLPKKHEDSFINFCIENEGKAIFLTLSNNKVYIGILVEFPKNIQNKDQTIMIMPIASGYRGEKIDGDVTWKTRYLQNDDNKFIQLIIPKREIITISLWIDEAEFQYIS